MYGLSPAPRLGFGYMVAIRSTSDSPTAALLSDPQSGWLAVRIWTRAEAMGLVHDVGLPGPSGAALADALTALQGAGIARSQVHDALNGRGGPELLSAINAALAASPVPETEWVTMAQVLGDDLLARLVGASATSVGRYRRKERPTPDPVANRLHFLAMVVADLVGSYNARGVRRWFCRPRPQLDGHTPEELLVGRWDTDERDPQRIADLAGALVGAAGAT